MNNEEKRTPKAYLPAGFFSEEDSRLLDLMSDVLSLRVDFRFVYYSWMGDNYWQACEVVVTHKPVAPAEVDFRMTPAKRFRSQEQTFPLTSSNWKKTHPTSVHWIRTMFEPAPSAGANHLLTGVRLAVGLRPSSGFKFTSDNVWAQKRIDEVMGNHRVWGVPTYGEIRFLTF
jgi:hypothetical protein